MRGHCTLCNFMHCTACIAMHRSNDFVNQLNNMNLQQSRPSFDCPQAENYIFMLFGLALQVAWPRRSVQYKYCIYAGSGFALTALLAMHSTTVLHRQGCQRQSHLCLGCKVEREQDYRQRCSKCPYVYSEVFRSQGETGQSSSPFALPAASCHFFCATVR